MPDYLWWVILAYAMGLFTGVAVAIISLFGFRRR